MNYELSSRLQACLDSLYPLQTVADIGTDHAYLPCIGILNKKLTKAIAADIGEGPLKSATATIKRYKLSEQIELRLGPGLAVLSPGEVDGVVIAGMGGKLIHAILDDNSTLTRSFKRLVLQPNIDANLVREWLETNSYQIIDEKIICEDNKYYEIIIAEPALKKIEYTEKDIEFGPILRRNSSNEIFKNKWEKNLNKIEEILRELPENHPRRKNLEKRGKTIKEVLNS